MRSSKLLGCCLSFQISEGIVESLGEIILLLSTKTIRPAELELQPWEKKCKLVIRCDEGEKIYNSFYFHPLVPRSMCPDYQRNNVTYYSLVTGILWDINLMRRCLPGSTGTESSVDDLAF